jgi:putative membrane protein
VRQEIVKSGKWQYIFPVLVSLSISAFYELIEWWVSVLTGSAGDAFL